MLENIGISKASTFNIQFDLITTSHVFYYLEEDDERQKSLLRLFEALKPGGKIFNLHSSENDSIGKQINLDIGHKIQKGPRNGFAPRGNWRLYAEDLHREAQQILGCKALVSISDSYSYTVSFCY